MMKRYIVFVLLMIAACNLMVNAQDENQNDSSAVVTNSFWDNWYGQVGVDMSLLFPSHHSVKDVFPNGKSFGVDVTKEDIEPIIIMGLYHHHNLVGSPSAFIKAI